MTDYFRATAHKLSAALAIVLAPAAPEVGCSAQLCRDLWEAEIREGPRAPAARPRTIFTSRR